MRMPARHLVADRRHHVGERERALLLRHPRMEHHLQQQVAELVLQIAQVAAVDRIGDFVGLLDGVGRDGREGLFDVPRATGFRVAQRGHDVEQVADVAHAVVARVAHAGSASRRATSPNARKSPLSRVSRWL